MSTARAVKKLAFTCEQCRRRKVKCDGAEPACGRCENRKETCEYKQSPTLIYTHTLEKRIKELEAEVAELKQQQQQQSQPQQASAQSRRSATKSPIPRTPESSAAGASDSSATTLRRFDGLKLDDKGVTTYHGTTSFFQLMDEREGDAPGEVEEGEQRESERQESRETLKINAWQQRAVENNSNVPEPFRYLIDLHWCWIQPLFNFVYRPAFTRDMIVLGPYYSHTLMNALLSHSVRWGRADPATRELLQAYDDGKVFARHSRDMIFEELRQGAATIPAIQTLLLLSAQECSLGNSAQAWVYSGIAFRLVDHLGVSVDGQRYGGGVALSDEDIEIRRRLFWSCYFWDKVISLYLGRCPSIQQTPVSPPQRVLDDSAEEELWKPHGISAQAAAAYTPQPSRSTSCFMSMCQLSVIFNQILIHMYDPTQQNTEAEMQDCILQEEVSLDRWWADLPTFLKIEAHALPETAPPSHIVNLMCLYHTFRILLYRPIFSWKSAEAISVLGTSRNRLQECVSSATSIIAIFNLYAQTFGERFTTLSLNYTVFIAASVFLLQAQATQGEHQAIRKLEFCIEILSRAKMINVVLGTSLDLILAKARDVGIEVHVPAPQVDFQSPPATMPIKAEQPMVMPYDKGLDDIDMTGLPTMAEYIPTADYLEPISVRVGGVEYRQDAMQ